MEICSRWYSCNNIYWAANKKRSYVAAVYRPGLILGLRLPSGRRSYFVTTPLIGLAQTESALLTIETGVRACLLYIPGCFSVMEMSLARICDRMFFCKCLRGAESS